MENLIHRIAAFSAIIVIALLAGCTKETDNAGFRNGSALSLGSVTTERMLTKSVITGTTFPAGEAARGIGLFLTATGGGNYDGKSTGYSNIKYSDNGSGWTSNSPMMLSATNGILYGYFPYNSSVADITAVPVESSLNGTDYMYAVPVTNVSKSSASVSLTMKHALARVSVKFIKDGSYTGSGALTAFSLEGKCLSSGGTMNAKTGNVTATGTNSVSYTVSETLTASGTTEECLLVSTADADRSLTLKCTIDGREYSLDFNGADTLCVRKGVNFYAIVTLTSKGLSISGTGIGEWEAGTNSAIEIKGGNVTVKRSNETVADDVFLDVTSDGSSVTIKTHSALTGRYLGCTCTPVGKADCASSIDETTGICTFTISSVQEDITAEVGYLKCNAIVVYDSDLGTVKVNESDVASGTPVQFFGGDEVKFLAEANSGCGFVKWTDGSGADLSTDNPYTIHRMTSDVPLNAVFGCEITVEPSEKGQVTGAGIYPKGSTATLAAVPEWSGVEFVGWVNKTATADKIKENPYSFTVTQPASYVAVFGFTDALPGLFTVNSDGKKVFFSKGNLWYGKVGSAQTATFNFEDKQYEFHGYDEANNIWGLFGWSTEKTNYGMSTSTDGWDYSGDFVDWGKAIGNGHIWRTLTSNEWQYLFNKDNAYGENNRSGKYKYGVTVCGKTNCMVLLPDDWKWEGSVGTGWQDDGYPETSDDKVTWKTMEDAGAVCLPAASSRGGSYVNVERFGLWGFYWTSSAWSSTRAYHMYFSSGFGGHLNYESRYVGYSVRLVADYQE